MNATTPSTQSGPLHARFEGPIVMIGFGSIGKGTLPLIERHFSYDKARFVVIAGGVLHKAKLPGYGRFFDAPNRMIEMVFAGVFDRFPELNVFFAETDFGWVPYVKEQIDNNYQRLDPVSGFGLEMLPILFIAIRHHAATGVWSFALEDLYRGLDREVASPRRHDGLDDGVRARVGVERARARGHPDPGVAEERGGPGELAWLLSSMNRPFEP